MPPPDHQDHRAETHPQSSDDSANLVTDPVCGMQIDLRTARYAAESGEKTYYFCSEGCKSKFIANPGAYFAGKAEAPPPAPKGTIYTCPMHPQIRQNGPGSCPICGMALEPEVVSLEDGANPELAAMTRRFWIGLLLSLPVVLLEMGGHLLPLHHMIGPSASNLVQLIFATPVVLWAGFPFFERGVQSLITRNLNMFTLIALGTGVAWLYSVVAALAPELFPPAFRGPDGAVAVYFEAAAVITVLVLLGQVLELRAREKTSNAIKALLGLTPKTARRLRADGTDEEVICGRPPGKRFFGVLND